MKFRVPLNQAQTTANGLGQLASAFLNSDQIAQQAELQAAPSLAQAAAQQAAARKADAEALKFGEETAGLKLKNALAQQRPENALQASLDAAGAVGPMRDALVKWRTSGNWGAPTPDPTLAGPPMEGDAAVMRNAPAPAGVNDHMLRAFLSTLAATGLSAVDGGNSTADNIAKAATALNGQGLRDAVLAGQVPASLAGTAQAALEGKPLVTGHEFGVIDNFTGAVNDQNPVAQRFGKFRDSGTAENVAQAGAARAAAANSYAAAGAHNASAAKTRQEMEQGLRTGDLKLITAEDGTSTIVNMRNGLGRPVVGMDGKPIMGGGGKPMTEGQAKANLFGARMAEADKQLRELEAGGVTRPGTIKGAAETAGRVAGLGTETMGGTLADVAGALTNFTQSPQQQRVEQARRDFINAVLRRESGAAIAASEFSSAEKQYFPQPGDSKDVIAQKQRNRALAIQGLAAEVPAGKALPSLSDAARGASAPAGGAGRTVRVDY